MTYRYIVINYSCQNYLNIRSNLTSFEKQVLKKYKQLNFHPLCLLNGIKPSVYQDQTSLLPSLVYADHWAVLLHVWHVLPKCLNVQRDPPRNFLMHAAVQ